MNVGAMEVSMVHEQLEAITNIKDILYEENMELQQKLKTAIAEKDSGGGSESDALCVVCIRDLRSDCSLRAV